MFCEFGINLIYEKNLNQTLNQILNTHIAQNTDLAKKGSRLCKYTSTGHRVPGLTNLSITRNSQENKKQLSYSFDLFL